MTISIGRETNIHIFPTNNQRKQSLRSALLSIIILFEQHSHSTTTTTQGPFPPRVPIFLLRHLSRRPLAVDMMNVERVSAAERRRGRRLRASLRHERQSIAMALAEMSHHSAPRGPRMARAGEEGHRNEYEAPRRQKPPPPQAFFRLFDEEDAERGLRPACLAEPRGPQERVQLRHRGAHRRRGARGPDSRCSCATGGRTGCGPAGGGVPAPRLAHSRSGYRSAQDLVFSPALQAQASPCAANGGTVGGSAGIRVVCSRDPSADR